VVMGIRLMNKTYYTDASDQDASVIEHIYSDTWCVRVLLSTTNPDVSGLNPDISRST
jgi:hypothetical protein